MDVQPVRCPCLPVGSTVWRRRPGVLGHVVPGIAAEEERPQVRVVKAEGERDGLAKISQRLVAGELELAPDLPAIGWGVYAAEDAHAKGVGRRRDRRSGGGHLQHSEATSGWGSNPIAQPLAEVAARLAEHLVTVRRRRRGLTSLTPPRVVTLRRDGIVAFARPQDDARAVVTFQARSVSTRDSLHPRQRRRARQGDIVAAVELTV